MTTDAARHDPDPARWEVIERAFQQASELSGAERTAVLDETCGDDSGIRREVEAMLAADGDTDSDFLCSPVLGGGASAVLEETSDAFIGKTIGRYHIKSIIARGGMGTVYEAVQESPHRVVALKILRRNIASRSALRRFQYESQILSRMRHPNIAPVYEAGVYDDGEGGVPYFAMEYIPGAKTITAYVEGKQLPTRERLELFAKVCDAAHHGHQKGIIHRDLKPANILVDSSGQPQVIDFGVARSTDSDLAVTTQQTDIGQLIGTMQYMSPEQCDGDPHDLDTRSDVYSLGVVLYELLTGQPPYNAASSTIYQAARMIREQDPPPLSSINRKLRGDVETIVLKALEKDRDKRYQSAEVLKQEIERFLRGEPIEARRSSMWRRGAQWLGRHPVASTGALCTLMVLTAVVVAFWAFGKAKATLGERPARFAYNLESMAAVLLSWRGDELGTWEQVSSVGWALIPASRTNGNGALAVIGFNELPRDDGMVTGSLNVYRADQDLDQPWWSVQVREEDLPAALRASGEKRAADFGVTGVAYGDVFPEVDGVEIIVGFVHPEAPAVLRIYDITGTLLYQVWHEGAIKEVMWMPKSRAVCFVAFNTEKTIEYWVPSASDALGYHPNAVVAVRPVLHEVRNDYITSGTGWGSYEPLWYKWVYPFVDVVGVTRYLSQPTPSQQGSIMARFSLSIPVKTEEGAELDVQLVFALDESGEVVNKYFFSNDSWAALREMPERMEELKNTFYLGDAPGKRDDLESQVEGTDTQDAPLPDG